jgi:hypothetical protein
MEGQSSYFEGKFSNQGNEKFCNQKPAEYLGPRSTS